jgi:SAM-dependent methyltransferase
VKAGLATSRQPESVIWHDVECGGYAADLSLWAELAAAAGGPILDLGCGTGRVALHLARKGHEVLGLDYEPALVAAFAQCAAGMTQAEAKVGDARDFDLNRRFDLVIAPMQLIQLFDRAEERLGCMRSVARHLNRGARCALAIVDSVAAPPETGTPPIPDSREVDGRVYSSLPVDVTEDGDSILVRRLRQTVSPEGELSDEVNDVRLCGLSAPLLEREAEAAGLRAVGRREIPPTDDHVGSTVALLEAS